MILKVNVANLSRLFCHVNILIQNIIQVFCVYFISVYYYDWITKNTVSMTLA